MIFYYNIEQKMAKHSEQSNISMLRVCLIMGMISVTLCSSLMREPNGVINQLDKRVRAIFNENTQLSNYKISEEPNSRVFYLLYESGLKATVNLNKQGLSIVEYDLSPQAKRTAAEKWDQKCIEKRPKIQSQQYVDDYLRKNKIIDGSFKLISFSVLKDGYLLQYSTQQVYYIFELSWDMTVRRRQTKKITKTPQPKNQQARSEEQEDEIVYRGIQQFLGKNLRFGGYKNIQLQKVARISKNQYKVLVVIRIRQRLARYELIIRINSSGQFQIQQTKQADTLTPQYSEQKQFDNEEISFIDELIRQNMQDKALLNYKISRIQRDGPFFKIYYKNNQLIYVIEGKIDPIRRKIKIIKVQQPKIQISTTSSLSSSEISSAQQTQLVSFVRQSFGTLPKSATVEKVTRLPNNRFLVIVVVTIRKREVRYQFTLAQRPSGEYSVEDSQFNFDFAPSFQEFPNTDDSAIVGLDAMVRDSLSEKLPAGVRLSRVERDEPFFRFTYTSGRSILQIQFIFDPIINRIQLKNMKYQQISEPIPQPQSTSSSPSTQSWSVMPYTQAQLNNIYSTLSQQFKDVTFKNYRVYRSQKLQYGYRIVFVHDNNYYEAILRYNSNNAALKVIRWRKITQNQSDSTDALSKYYPVSLDGQLESILLKTIPRQKLGQVKRILDAKSRISSDGYYYQITLETGTDHQYLVNVYYNPLQGFTQILGYEQINSNYYISADEMQKLTEQEYVPDEKSSQFMNILEFIQGKYDNFASSSIIYVYRTNVVNKGVIVYRIGLISKLGVYYEITLAYVMNVQEVHLIRYYKLYDGYSLGQIGNAQIKSIVQFYVKSSQKQLGNASMDESQISNVLVRQLPQIGKFYKLILSRQRITISLFQAGQKIKITGAQAIPYYYTIIVKGFKSFGQIGSLLSSARAYFGSKVEVGSIREAGKYLSIDSTSAELHMGYDPSADFNCLSYRQGRCMRCSYRFFILNGQCAKVADQCKQYKRQTGECLACYTGYYLTGGVCSAMNQLCQSANQIGHCVKCYKGYNLIEGGCFKTMVSHGSNLQRQIMDPLCEQQANGVCTRCVGGTYLSRKTSKCAVKDPFCEQFDQIREVVVRCQRGYALSGGKCVRNM